MRILILLLLILAAVAPPCWSSVELARQGKDPQEIKDIYLRDGQAFIAIDDILQAVELQGDWDSVAHRYNIRTPFGTAWLAPDIPFLQFEGHSTSLSQAPRFIDGRLRVDEAFIHNQLPLLTGTAIYYRNLEPATALNETESDNPLDRLFSFLLRKKRKTAGPILRGVAIDPGHGGQDVGVIGPKGTLEKQLTLSLAQQLEKLIKMRLGIPVYLSRDKDYGLSLEQRLAPARRDDVDAWLLLHVESSLDPRPAGVALLIRPAEKEAVEGRNTGASLQLARQLELALRQAGVPVLGIYRSALVGLGQGDLPTVLVECGFLSQPDDRARLVDADGREMLARALFEGLKNFAKGKRKEH